MSTGDKLRRDATILKDTPKEFKVSELPRATPEAIAKFLQDLLSIA